jgi:hypothetical protein
MVATSTIKREDNFIGYYERQNRRPSAAFSKGDPVSVQKRVVKKAVVLGMGAALVWVFCSNPTRDNLNWRSAIDIPVSNASFVIGRQFQDLFEAVKDLKDFSMRGIDSFTVDSARDSGAHCIAFSKTSRDTITFTQKQDTLGVKSFQVTIGAIPLSSAGDKTVRVAFGTAGTVAAEIQQSATATISLPKIQRIVIDADPANARLPVRIVNATAATIDNVVIALPNILPAVPSLSIGRLAAAGVVDTVFLIPGRTIESTVQVQITGTPKAGGSIATGTGFDVSVSFSKLKASYAVVMDSLLAISDTFTNKYKITDSVNIEYADIDVGFFNYFLNNRSGIDLYVSAEHHDLWITPACEKKNVKSYRDLPRLANSSDSFNYYSGHIIDGDRHVEPRQNKKFASLNLSRNRMFPRWADSNSVSRVDYIVRTEPRGAWDTIRSSDSLIFIIQPTAMSYKQMAGKLVKDFNKTSDTQTVEVPFPWPKANQDSLRGNFLLQKVLANMSLNLSLPDSAYLDSILVNFRVFAPQFRDSIVDTTVTIGTLKNDTVYKRALNITRVINNFPDSVKIVSRVKVPAGVRMCAINDPATTGRNVGTMTIKAFVNYRLNAFLDWTVVDTATMDLGTDTFTIDGKGVRLFQRMSDRLFDFKVQATNHSNVNIRLFALFAPDKMRKTLYVDSLTLNQVNKLVSDTSGNLVDAFGVVNLLGTKGLYIPHRDSVVQNSITLTDKQMEKILNTRQGSMRWMLRFVKSGRDSMTNTDNIKLNSWIHLEGVNNMGSVVTAY